MSSSVRAERRAAGRSALRGPGLLRAVVAAALLGALARAVDWRVVAAALAGVRAGWLAAAVLAYLAVLPLWAAQWWLLLPPADRPRPARLLDVVVIGSAAMGTTSFLVGGPSTAVLLTRAAGVRPGSAAALLVVDQLLVGIAKLAVLGAAAALLPLPDWVRRGGMGLALGVTLLALALAAAARPGPRRAAARVVRAGARAVARRRPRARRAAAATVRAVRAAGQAAAVTTPRRLAIGLALALAKSAAEAAGILAVQRAAGVALPPANALLVLAAINFATLLPLAPANVGVYEAAAFAAYRHFGLPPGQALALAALHHVIDLAALVAPGAIRVAWPGRGAPPPHAPPA